MFEIGHFLSLFDLGNVLYYKRTSEVNMFNVGDLVKCKEMPYLLFVVVKVLDAQCDVYDVEFRKIRRLPNFWLSKIKTDKFCP